MRGAKSFRVHCGHRPPEEISLSFIAVLRDQGAALFGRLDSFRRDGNAELMAELQDCTDDRIVLGIGAKRLHVAAVDLQLVEVQSLEVVYARRADAEVVKRNAD